MRENPIRIKPGLEYVKASILMLFLYIVQFLVFPWILPNYYRISNESFGLYWFSFALIVSLGSALGIRNILMWIPGDILYLICVKLYSAGGAYNAQLDGHYRLEYILIVILIYMTEFILFQLLVLGIISIFHKVGDFIGSHKPKDV